MALTLHGTVADNTAVLSRQNAKPLIINGGMTVAQRGTVTGITNPGTYTLDRIRADIRGGFGVQVAQSTDVPSGYGFGNSLKLDVTTADTSPDADGLLLLGYHFEGQDVQLLKYGTSSAETTTVAFWIKSNKTGTFQCNLRMADAYNIVKIVTISSTNTWEKKVITFVGNTSNAMANDNSDELRIQFFFDAGSNHEGGGVPSSWAAVSATKDYNGSIDLGDNTANEVLITGLQMEVGSFDANSIASFQHESFGNNLARCQRYCQVYGAYGNMMIGAGMTQNATIAYRWGLPLIVEMRANPSGALSGTCNLWNGAIGANAALGTSYNKTDFASYDMTCDSGLTATTGLIMMLFLNTGTLTLTAEL